MPTSPETRRITDREWEDRKLRICELYIDLGRRLEGHDGVIETMAKEDFTATVPQYEHRFRKWRVRKNIKRAEWERIIHDTQQGGEIIRINQTISRPKLQRAQRRYTCRIHRGEEQVSRNHDVTAVATAVDIEMDAVRSSQDMQLISPNRDSIAIDHDIPTADFSNFNPSLHGPDNLIRDASPPCSGAPLPVGPVLINPLQANRNSRLLWLPSLPSSQLVTTVIKGILAKTSDPRLLEKFSNAMTKSDPTSRGPTPSPIFDIFKSLYSVENFAGEDWSLVESKPASIALEARFDGRLIASIINGFAGLENVPASGVLGVLDRHRAMQEAVIGILNIQSSPEAKSFAEKLFLLYLQTDNTEVVKYLLSTRLVDANEAVYHCNGEKYTPLEIAAVSQSFEVLRLLISEGVDINKSFRREYHFNALHLLIHHLDDRRSTLDDNFLSLVDVFLGTGAAILIDTIQAALRFIDPRLAIRLIENVASQAPQKLISHKDLLEEIIKNLEKEYATSIIKLIINNCQKLGRARYLSKFYLHVDNALNEAAMRGYDELVGIMFPYASIPGKDKSFQTAVEFGYPTIVELILQKDPSLDEDLDLDGDTKDSETFISALRSGDHSRLRSLEEKGVLSHLQGYRLGQALTAALKAGNLEYATKILDLDPDFEFYEPMDLDLDDSQRFNVADAMDAALAHDFFNDIAWKLLAVGVTTQMPFFRRLRPAPLLYVAVVRKRPDFIKIIMETGCDPDILRGSSNEEWRILEAAIEYCEYSVFEDILKACPRLIFPSDRLLRLVLEKGHVDLFLNMVKSGPQHRKSMALQIAVECENGSVLEKLISLGARADNDDVLEIAIEYHPSMVRPLLDRFWKAFPQGRAGYGQGIVHDALSNCLESPEFLDQVFAWDLVRLNVNYQAYPGRETLLLRAIETENPGVVKKFIDAGSEVNSVERDNMHSDGYVMTTPLLTAIKNGIVGIVQLLIDNGADVNKPAMYGIRRTPLQKATEMNNLPIVRLLLSNGARVNGKPSMFDGGTALQFAAIRGNCEMATILIEHGAEYNIPPPFGRRGRWPLEGAAENGRLDMIELLWNAPWDPFDNKQYESAMRYAERNGHFGCKEKIKELMARSSS